MALLQVQTRTLSILGFQNQSGFSAGLNLRSVGVTHMHMYTTELMTMLHAHNDAQIMVLS